MNRITLTRMLSVLRTYTLYQLDMYRPQVPSAQDPQVKEVKQPQWSVDLVQLVANAITAHIEFVIRNNESVGSQANRELLAVSFKNPLVDEVAINRILNDGPVLATIPAHLRQAVGKPLLVFKYDMALGLLFINTREYTHLKEAELNDIRSKSCGCDSIADEFKVKGFDGCGIVTSQFHRFRSIIMSGDNFILRMADLIAYMVSKGHHAVRMLDRVHGLSRRFPELYGRDPKVLWEATSKEFYTMAGNS